MSESHHYQSLSYQGECRECNHQINQSMPPKPELRGNTDGIHIRCANCGTTNHLQKGHDD